MPLFFFLILFLSFKLDADMPRITAEAEPIASVADCVNVVTGEFFQVDTDLIVDTPSPIHFTRCYDSGSSEKSWLGYKWGSHIPLRADPLTHDNETNRSVCIPQREGALYKYTAYKEHGHLLDFSIDTFCFKYGLTNYSQ